MSSFAYSSERNNFINKVMFYIKYFFINRISFVIDKIMDDYNKKIIAIKKEDDILARRLANEIISKNNFLFPAYIKVGNKMKDSKSIINMFGLYVIEKIGDYYIVHKNIHIDINIKDDDLLNLQVEKLILSNYSTYYEKLFNTVISEKMNYIESPFVKNIFDYYRI